MKKTKIAFEDIKAGDLLEVVLVDGGVKAVLTGIAFQKEEVNAGWQDAHVFWSTSEGSMVVAKHEEGATIYRVDVAEAKFADIREGDRIRVTRKVGYTEQTITGVASYVTDGLSNNYWLTIDGHMLVTRLETGTIEILERGE